MRIQYRAGIPVLLSVLLAACPSAPRRPAPVPTRPSVEEAPDLRGAAVYTVNPMASAVHILVFRGGALASRGHNHVVTSRTLTGKVWTRAAAAQSGFDLSFPVGELIVDDPDARRAAGGDFPPEIPQADRDGTRRNMLRTEVLDAEHYPTITLHAVGAGGPLQSPRVTARIAIKGATRDVAVPVTVQIDDSRLIASGSFTIRQTDFGIKPFSVALGLLEVKDELEIRFRIVAERERQEWPRKKSEKNPTD